MKRLVAISLGVLVWNAAASAKGDKNKDKDDEDTAGEDSSDDEKPDKEAKEAKGDKKKKDKEEDDGEPKDFKKQDLNGHDGATSKKSNLFEKDRFFVDKTDDEKTEKKTLTQGSLTSTSFLYRESGGNIAPTGANVPSASQFTRVFTDLRLQTDFRHLGGSKWDARIDARGRFTSDPGSLTPAYTPATNSTSQSGFLGQNELEIRELWLIRNGKRSDVTLGRQFVADLAGVKFDGLRIDYASSSKFTLLGFGGLYPIRGSRSITTDYQPLLGNPDPTTGVRTSAGRFTGAGGFGAAYRTPDAYGSFGGVALAPFSSEAPRIFGTSTGYWRVGPKLDFYHFIVIDAVGSNAVNAGLTNLSGGLNWKPDQRLRGTFSFNRVDTETLNVQAQAFLSDPEKNINIIQNEAFLSRVAQNEARASLSAGLGSLQRFEITTAVAYRYRGEITLVSPATTTPLTVILPAGKAVEVYGSITDRRSFANLRLGVDGSRVFRAGGNDTYQHTTSSAFRVFAGRELENGHGEWEAEVAYSTTQDDSAGKMGLLCADFLTCYGTATSTILSAGGSLFYRFNRDWFGMGGLYINRQDITSFNGAMGTADPTVTGISGFVRAAYRF
jgi:hypothetical protein